MTRLGIAVIALLSAAAPSRAQFETPNRAFHKSTGFPLEGRHEAVACESCHVNGQYRGTPTTCFGCHWERRRDDPYQTSLGSQCEECHRPTSWTAVRWDHGSQSGVPLNVDHRLLDCQSCHSSTSFAVPVVDCVSCHQQDYATTATPNHAAAGFPMGCESCHRPGDVTWQSNDGRGFVHAAAFPLVGAHATAACASCHQGNVYLGTARECAGCHMADYQRTTAPSHAAAGFPTACESCHRPTDAQWTGAAQFEHDAVFRLEGAHAAQACAACHTNNVFAGTPSDCIGCHQDDYNAAANPNHVSAGFATSCENCHQPTRPWSGGGFDHNARFRLEGAHASQACASCHVNNVFAGTPRDCVGCHQDDYDRTAQPGHRAAGFSTDCESCHRPTSPWGDAGFDHDARFELVGRHASASCASCHPNGRYSGTPRDCFACHQSDYQATRDPNHVSSGFPTGCDSCHRPTDSSWNEGRFVHSGFPLRGPHDRDCAQCHTTPSNYALFSCTGCHSRSETDSEHREESGYRYDSLACYACHPDGDH
jgi:hypothetical protein